MSYRKIVSFLFLAGLLTATGGQAAIPISVDSFTDNNYGQTNRSDFANSPLLVNYSESLMGMTDVGIFKVGIGGSFRFIRQMSTVDPTSGSLDGNRWEFYPVLSRAFTNVLGADFTVTLAPIYWLGRYNLNNNTAAGTSLSYQNPFGARTYITHDFGKFSIFPNLGAGLMGEYTIYGKTVDSSAGSTTLTTNHLKTWAVGLALHIGIL